MFRLGSLLLCLFISFLASVHGISLKQSTWWLTNRAAVFDRLTDGASEAGAILQKRLDTVSAADFNVSKRATTGTLSGEFPCQPATPPTSGLSVTDPDFRCLLMPSVEEVDASNTGGSKRSVGRRINFPTLGESKRSLEKRVDGTIREIFNSANVKVPTNGGDIIFWRSKINDQEVQLEQTIATEDLCGCTVVVVASPYVAIMIHILEQRNSDQFWWLSMDGADQQQVDQVFMSKANELMDEQLAKLQGQGQTSQPTLQNNFNGWLPAGQTTVTVLAPQWNMDYYNTIDSWVFMKQGQYVYPQQVDALKTTMLAKVIGTDEAMVTDVSYRRRYWSADPQHRQDDRDLAAVAPTPNINDGGPANAIMAGFYFDDHGFLNVARIGTSTSS